MFTIQKGTDKRLVGLLDIGTGLSLSETSDGTPSLSSTGGVSVLDDLSDVAITSPSSGQVLQYNGTSWVNASASGTSNALNDLTDVTITSPTTGQHVRYNGSVWVNAALDAADLTGTVASARLSGAYTGVTGLGTLTALTISGQLTSTQASGTAPFVVTSTTVSTNLNADLLDGQHGSYYQNASNLTAGLLPWSRFPNTSGTWDLSGNQAALNGGLEILAGSASETNDLNKVRIAGGSSARIQIFPSASGAPWQLDNSSGTLRFFLPGVVKAQLKTDGSFLIGNDIGSTQLLRVAGGAAFGTGAPTLSNTLVALISSSTTALAVTPGAAPGLVLWDGLREGSLFVNASGLTLSALSNHALNFAVNNSTKAVLNTDGSLLLGSEPSGLAMLRVGNAANNAQVAKFAAGSGTQNSDIVWIGSGATGSGYNLLNIMRGASYATPTFKVSGDGSVIVGADPTGSGVLRMSGALSMTGAVEFLSASTSRWSIGLSGAGGVQIKPTAAALDSHVFWLNSSSQVLASLDCATGSFQLGGFNDNHLLLLSSNSAYGWRIDTHDFGGGDVPLRIYKRTASVDTIALTLKNADGGMVIGSGTDPNDGSLVRVVGRISSTDSFAILRRDTKAIAWQLYSQAGDFAIYSNAAGADRFTMGSDGHIQIRDAVWHTSTANSRLLYSIASDSYWGLASSGGGHHWRNNADADIMELYNNGELLLGPWGIGNHPFSLPNGSGELGTNYWSRLGNEPPPNIYAAFDSGTGILLNANWPTNIALTSESSIVSATTGTDSSHGAVGIWSNGGTNTARVHVYILGNKPTGANFYYVMEQWNGSAWVPVHETDGTTNFAPREITGATVYSANFRCLNASAQNNVRFRIYFTTGTAMGASPVDFRFRVNVSLNTALAYLPDYRPALWSVVNNEVTFTSLKTFAHDITIGTLGRFDSTKTPTTEQLLSYDSSIAKWVPKTVNLSIHNGVMGVGQMADGSYVTYADSNPTLSGVAPAPVAAPVLTVVYKGIIVDMSATAITGTEEYHLYYSTDGFVTSNVGPLVVTSDKVVHSDLDPTKTYSYRFKTRGAVTANISASTWATPIQITAYGHNFRTGDTVVVANHTLNTAANGTWVITVVDVNNFTLNGSVGIATGGATGTATENPYDSAYSGTASKNLNGDSDVLRTEVNAFGLVMAGQLAAGLITAAKLNVDTLDAITGTMDTLNVTGQITAEAGLFRALQHSTAGNFGELGHNRVLLVNDALSAMGDARTSGGEDNESVRLGSHTISGGSLVARTTANQGTGKGWTDPDGTADGANTLTLYSGNEFYDIVAAGSRVYNIVGDPTQGQNVDAYDDRYTLQFKVTADSGTLIYGDFTPAACTAWVTVEYSTDGGTNWTPVSGIYSVYSGVGNYATQTITPTVVVSGAPSQLRFRLRLEGGAEGQPIGGTGTVSVQIYSTLGNAATAYPITWTSTAGSTYKRRGLKLFATSDGSYSMPHVYLEPLAGLIPYTSAGEGELAYVGGSAHELYMRRDDNWVPMLQKYSCQTYVTSQYLTTDNVTYTVSWGAESWDTSNFWSSGTSLTIPSGIPLRGMWQVTANVGFNGSTAATGVKVTILRNGSAIAAFNQGHTSNVASATLTDDCNLTAFVKDPSVSDYFQVQVLTRPARYVMAGAGVTWFNITKLW